MRWMGFSGGSVGKASSWVRKIPWRKILQPTPILLPGKLHGRRSLVSYSPWGRKESDTTEQLPFPFNEVDELEPIIQSELCQKEKNKYKILMHICGI